jgi:hypothetical protein
MSALYKSKLGMLSAGIYLLTVLACLLYLVLIDKHSVMVIIIHSILTAPWWLLYYTILPEAIMLPVMKLLPGTGETPLFILMALGGLINAFILYILGFLLTKAFNYVSSTKPKP